MLPGGFYLVLFLWLKKNLGTLLYFLLRLFPQLCQFVIMVIHGVVQWEERHSEWCGNAKSSCMHRGTKKQLWTCEDKNKHCTKKY